MKNQITTNTTAISSTEAVVSSHTKSILWIAQAARTDVSKCLLGGAGFRKSPLHCATGLVSHIHIMAYGSTPYVGWPRKKMAARLKVHK